MKQHVITAAVAATISAAAVGGVVSMKPAPKQTVVTHSVQASKHAWPDMSDAEVAALAKDLAWLKGGKVIVLCDGADCRDLQTDIDNSFEDAGVDSTRDRPIIPLGYGVAIFADESRKADAQRVADAMKSATAGRLSPKVEIATTAGDMLIVAIGKRLR